MKNIYYITLPLDASQRRPQPIAQKQWDAFCDDVRQLVDPQMTPHDFEALGHKHQGAPLIDSNAISISPPEGQGTDLVIKRQASKVVIKTTVTHEVYATIVAAIMLALKRRVPEVIISNKLKWDGMKDGVQYFQYVLEGGAPVIHPSMAGEVTVKFKWLANLSPEDAESVIEDIRALLGGNAEDISVRFDS